VNREPAHLRLGVCTVAAQGRLRRVLEAVRGGIRESAMLDLREREWTSGPVHRSLRATLHARAMRRARLRDVAESEDRKIAVIVEESDLDGRAKRDELRARAPSEVDLIGRASAEALVRAMRAETQLVRQFA
jgi:hypothetical protein